MRNPLVMLIKIFGLIILIVSTTSAQWKTSDSTESGSDEYKWDRTEKILFGTFVLTSVVDLSQTQYIFKHDELRELNLVINAIGPEWTPLYFAIRALSICWIADKLPSGKQRKTMLGLTNAINLFIVGRNYYLGVKLSF